VAGVGSFFVAEEAHTLRAYAQTVRPARATLRSAEVKRWIETRDNWSAFGTFDIVAGDHQGVAEGNLVPLERRTRHRSTMSQQEAAQFLGAWELGRTYDGYWNPEQPDGVFFDKVDFESGQRLSMQLAAAAGLLAVAGFALWRRRAATPPRQ
jgi:MYXO-CTERM domain-containing protein